MTEKIAKPQLRFAGFDDTWEQRKLGEIADKVTEKNGGLQYIETFTNSAEFGIISQRDFFDHDIAKIESLNGYYIVRNEDFVYNPRISTSAPVGPINRNKLGRIGVMSPLYTVFRPHDVDTTYLEHFFKSKYWHSFMNYNGDSGARSDRFSIKDSVFFEMPIPIPHIEEQRKIGAYLFHLDNLITLHQRNSADFVSRFFSDFTNTWEQRKLGELTSLITKGTTPLDKSNIGTVNFVKIESIDNLSGEITITQKISSEEHEGYLRRSQLKENDILFSIAGTLGRVTSVKSSILPANTNQALAIIRLKSGCLKYVKTYLKGKAVADFIKKNPTIGAQPNLSLEQVSNIEIALPSEIEQAQIGSFFENLDHLITLHQRESTYFTGGFYAE